MEQKVFSDEQYYIVSLDNGIREEEPISIEVFNTFKDGSSLVQLNKNVFGVYKNNCIDPNTSYIDDYEIIKADIAELFDVDHEETKRIVTEDKNMGIFTVLNYSKEIETRISATAILNHIIDYINRGVITGEDAKWLTQVINMPATDNSKAIKDHNKIEALINLGIYSLEKEIELHIGMPLDEKKRDANKKNYLRMILFDYIVDKKFRGLDYYLISKVTEDGKPTWHDSYFAPISITNNVAKENGLSDAEYILNNHIIDRKELINVLFEKFYNEIKKMSESLNDAKKLYKDAISRIIYNNTDLEHAAEFETIVMKNLDYLNQVQELKEKELNKEEKINKVEKTMATQSLNIRVTTKLDLIQKKYPINPKDHPELINASKEKLKNDTDNVRLIVEKEKKSNSGFIGTAILVSIIALVCGIGLGIAYVLMTFGG